MLPRVTIPLHPVILYNPEIWSPVRLTRLFEDQPHEFDKVVMVGLTMLQFVTRLTLLIVKFGMLLLRTVIAFDEYVVLLVVPSLKNIRLFDISIVLTPTITLS